MNAFDYGVLLILFASILAGVRRGVVRSLVGISSLVLGLYFASRQYSIAADLLRPWVGNKSLSHVCGFAAVMGLILLLGALVGRTMQTLLRTANMGWIDRLFGAGFGFVRGWSLGSIIYLALMAFSYGSKLTGSGVTSPYLRWGADRLNSVSSSEFTKRFQLGSEAASPVESKPGEAR